MRRWMAPRETSDCAIEAVVRRQLSSVSEPALSEIARSGMGHALVDQLFCVSQGVSERTVSGGGQCRDSSVKRAPRRTTIDA